MKRQKALAAGRDLDKERIEQEENAKRGEGRKRREEVGARTSDSCDEQSNFFTIRLTNSVTLFG